jgi:hypothetical protein
VFRFRASDIIDIRPRFKALNVVDRMTFIVQSLCNEGTVRDDLRFAYCISSVFFVAGRVFYSPVVRCVVFRHVSLIVTCRRLALRNCALSLRYCGHTSGLWGVSCKIVARYFVLLFVPPLQL